MICNTCHLDLLQHQFYTNNKRCKTCCKAYQKAWVKANPERQQANLKRWRENHPTYSIDWQRSNKAARVGHKRRSYIRKTHGLTEAEYGLKLAKRLADRSIKEAARNAEYAQMLDQQNGTCAICFGINRNGDRLCRDHNHTTGVVRGLLCHACNRGIGMLKDSTTVLQSAIDYLNRSML